MDIFKFFILLFSQRIKDHGTSLIRFRYFQLMLFRYLLCCRFQFIRQILYHLTNCEQHLPNLINCHCSFYYFLKFILEYYRICHLLNLQYSIHSISWPIILNIKKYIFKKRGGGNLIF